ncbi:MAG: glycosyltransferase family 1 protein, partial [Bacteroidales bacterium]|nr:glycosyltransferase family 1 protein [Bacteroidales bacterium]
MKKRKILWFSGAQFSEDKIKTTGTWLIAMGIALAKSEDIELYNVTYGDEG